MGYGTFRGKSMKPGGGGRFAKMVSEGVPPGVAAEAGRKKYGASKMAEWAAKGRKSTKGSPSFTGAELATGYRKMKD